MIPEDDWYDIAEDDSAIESAMLAMPLYDEDGNEIELIDDDDDDMSYVGHGETYVTDDNEVHGAGFEIEHPDGEEEEEEDGEEDASDGMPNMLDMLSEIVTSDGDEE